MFTTDRIIRVALFIILIASTVLAQESTPIDYPREQTPAPLVNARASAERVRFVSPGNVVQLRLEVFNETGQKVFDTELRGGNVLDWQFQNGSGQRLQAGAYACVLTIKSLSGRLSQRMGRVRVDEKQAVMEAAGAQLSSAQQQTIGPVEGNAGFNLQEGSEAEAITTVTHDGAKGQLNRTRGALSFGVGDLFSGSDKEQMRLTEAGDLGIGTDKPQAKLDVNGDVRASGSISATQGIEFADGTVQTTGLSGHKDKDGVLVPNVGGTGTQNKLAKWIDNAGTLGDSTLFENGGLVGIGTTSPNANAALHVDRSQNTGTSVFVSNTNTGVSALASMRAGLNPANFAVDYASLNILGTNWPAGVGGPLLKSKTVLMEGAGSNFGIGNTNSTEPIQFYTTPSRVERMRITGTGLVGIGEAAPTHRLTVTDPSNAGLRVATALSGGTVASFGGSGDFNIDASGTPGGRFTVKETGDVGIGASTPQARLDVQPSFGAHILFTNAGCGNNFAGIEFIPFFRGPANLCSDYSLLGDGTSTLINRPVGGQLLFRENNITQMIILAGGRVGVGTDAPAEKFSVQTPTSNYGFIHTDGTVTVGSFVGGVTGGGWYGTKSNHALHFFVNNGAASMTIATSGNVGVGTNTPNAKLQVDNGNVYMGTSGSGMILKSPNGLTCRLVTIDNTGSLVTTAISCP